MGESENKDYARLRLFILSPDLRGQGWGRQLLEQSIDFAKEQKFKGIYLWKMANWEPAGQMYRNHGFKSEEIVMASQWGKEALEEKMILTF